MSMAMGSTWEDDFDTSAIQEYRHWEDYRRLKAENAKLRKLLGKYHYTLLAYKEEDDDSPCPLYICPDTTMCPWPWDNVPCPFVEAINELGIEADE